VSIEIGDTFAIDGRPFEVVDEHDGHFTLDNGGESHHFTEEQLQALPRVEVCTAAFALPDSLALFDSGLEQ